MSQRFFWAYEITTKWPDEKQKISDNARVISYDTRHITTLFLGKYEEEPLFKMIELLDQFLETMPVAPSGLFSRMIPLPPKKKHCLAFEAELITGKAEFIALEKKLQELFFPQMLPSQFRPSFPHMTFVRAPFSYSEWKELYKPLLPLPFATSHHTLFESDPKQSRTYLPRKRTKLIAPFEEIDHTADRGFLIRGTTLEDLALNAFLALGWYEPRLFKIHYLQDGVEKRDLTDIIDWVNQALTKVDIEYGSRVKAVSHHGEIHQKQSTAPYLEWEMIIDI